MRMPILIAKTHGAREMGMDDFPPREVGTKAAERIDRLMKSRRKKKGGGGKPTDAPLSTVGGKKKEAGMAKEGWW